MVKDFFIYTDNRNRTHGRRGWKGFHFVFVRFFVKIL